MFEPLAEDRDFEEDFARCGRIELEEFDPEDADREMELLLARVQAARNSGA